MSTIIGWIRANAKLPGHLATHNALRTMTEVVCSPSKKAKDRIYEGAAFQKLLSESASQQNQQTLSQKVSKRYTWRLDAALTGKDTVRLYEKLGQHQAAILVQARSGHNHLNVYRAKIKPISSGRCSCGQGAETLEYIILRCPRWESQRLALIAATGSRWSDMSYLLGGYSSCKAWNTELPVDSPKEKWKLCIEVVNAKIEFLIETERMVPQQGYRRNDEE